jgi:cyclopropane fatty-acyl-phospholipid synthase-like methyltransferase
LLNAGFFDEMEAKGKVDVQAFAQANDLDAEILQALCDALYVTRVLQKNGTGYKLDAKGKILLGKAKGWFWGVYGYEHVYHNLDALLRKEITYGKDIYRKPDFIAKGFGEMESHLYFPLAVDIIEREGYQHVIDLGCGEGTFLRHLCATTGVTGYGIDLAPVAIAEAKRAAAAEGLQDRLHFHVLDINQIAQAPDEIRGIDAATCFFVLHELRYEGVETVVTFLNSFRTLFPGVPLMVFEIIRPTPEELRRRPGIAAMYLMQHDITRQKLVGLDEWREMFRAAGFSSVEERYSPIARTAIFTLR